MLAVPLLHFFFSTLSSMHWYQVKLGRPVLCRSLRSLLLLLLSRLVVLLSRQQRAVLTASSSTILIASRSIAISAENLKKKKFRSVPSHREAMDNIKKVTATMAARAALALNTAPTAVSTLATTTTPKAISTLALATAPIAVSTLDFMTAGIAKGFAAASMMSALGGWAEREGAVGIVVTRQSVEAAAAMAAGASLALATAPIVVKAIGFTSAGIAKGSAAASMMSAFGGLTPAGGYVATGQAIGATGTVFASTSAVIATGAVGLAAGYIVYRGVNLYLDHKMSPNVVVMLRGLSSLECQQDSGSSKDRMIKAWMSFNVRETNTFIL